MYKKTFITGFIFLFLTACSAIQGPPTETPAPTLTASPLPSPTLNLTATSIFEATVESGIATAAAQARSTEIQITRDARSTATQIAAMESTAQAQPMADRIAELYGQGYVTSTDGRYFSLQSFEDSIAQLRWFFRVGSGLVSEDFVIRADITWDVDSETADWWVSGCGYAFRIQDDSNFYVLFLTMDGYVTLLRWQNNQGSLIGTAYYGPLDHHGGSANIELSAVGAQMNVFINGQHELSRTDTRFGEGLLSFVLISGTNAGFGTMCRFENIEYWDFDPNAEPIYEFNPNNDG